MKQLRHPVVFNPPDVIHPIPPHLTRSRPILERKADTLLAIYQEVLLDSLGHICQDFVTGKLEIRKGCRTTCKIG